jgi:hypothetical protein
MTRGRRTWREAGISVAFSARERTLLLKHTFADPEYANRLVETGGRWVAEFTAGELDDILGHLAAAANDARRAKLRQELDALIDSLEPMIEAVGPTERDAF